MKIERLSQWAADPLPFTTDSQTGEIVCHDPIFQLVYAPIVQSSDFEPALTFKAFYINPNPALRRLYLLSCFRFPQNTLFTQAGLTFW